MVYIICFTGNTLSELVEGVESPSVADSPAHQGTFAPLATSIFRRALESRVNKVNTQKYHRFLGSPEVRKVVLLCSLYQTALNTLTQLRLDILTGTNDHIYTCSNMIRPHCFIAGLCYQDRVLYDLWLFLCSLGPNCGLKAFLDHLSNYTKCTAPEFQMLQLFADCMTHNVTYVFCIVYSESVSML